MSQPTDLQTPIQRFPAIVGANQDLATWLDPATIAELNLTTETKYRTKHHQLTIGAIGCFLSHYKLYQMTDHISLIFEDDALLDPNINSNITYILANPPPDWDIILLGHSGLMQSEPANLYVRVKSFWGMQGYLINKKGADKIINSVKTIDAQIDAYLSWMAIHNMINIYASNRQIVRLSQHCAITNIQYKLVVKNKTDQFTYNNTYLGP